MCHSESDGSVHQAIVEYDHQYDESQRGVWEDEAGPHIWTSSHQQEKNLLLNTVNQAVLIEDKNMPRNNPMKVKKNTIEVIILLIFVRLTKYEM